MKNCDIAVIGAGPAGLAAALAAREAGIENVAVFERGERAGGILPQCIHNGFGLHRFGEELTGPEYAQRYCNMLSEAGVPVYTRTMVLSLDRERNIEAISRAEGYIRTRPKAVVLAMGCRERTAGAISLAGSRPSGIFTAGTAQRYMNIEGYAVGRRAVILGSGDIGLIMARRLTLEGAKVEAVLEIMPFSSGLNRNIVQCLRDFSIPLYLSHTVTRVHGNSRITGVTAARTDENRRPIPGTEFELPCDVLLLSVGLIPENELSRQAGVPMDARTGGAFVSDDMQTEIPGIFAAGNVLHVHDLVDFVSQEGADAGRSAAEYVKSGGGARGELTKVSCGEGISCAVPQFLRQDAAEKAAVLYVRVRSPERGCVIRIDGDGEKIAAFRRERVTPGEMEKLKLPLMLFKGKKEIRISLCRAQEEGTGNA